MFIQVFPRDSRLTGYFSRAILNVTESPDMNLIEEKNFGSGYSSQNQLDSSINKQTSLTTYNFGGLFIIIVSATIFTLLYSVPSLGKQLIGLSLIYILKSLSFLPLVGNFFRINSSVHSCDGKDSSSEQEVEMSEQVVGDSLAMVDMVDHQSGQGDSNVSVEGNESYQRNDSNVSPR